MNYPGDLKYTKSHEWVRLEGEIATVGISDYAQDALGDVVFVELPAVGKQVSAEDSIAVVESVKTASDIYAPVAGEVVEANSNLNDKPELLNQDPYGGGWIFKIKVSGGLDGLLSASEYQSFAESQA
jgi:glycine cleavage system H protein